MKYYLLRNYPVFPIDALSGTRLSLFNGNYFNTGSEMRTWQTSPTNFSRTIICIETFVEDGRWNFTIADELLGSNTFYITILRDPVYQFESMFNFFDLREFYKVSSFDGFIEKLENGTLREDRFLNIAGRNQLSFMLGLQPESFSNETAIEEFSSYISSKFHLVMISEYFDESVILLKNLLGSPIGHMLYVPKLTRTKDSKQNLTKKQKLLVEKWLHADMRIYNNFKK
ncbi:hypothetical protein QYM36_002644 [Artemia franciscana]|uniref:Sulfotransferase family protein n=1 Tax=Artemia franciscana TaxID=6661 RepID=A0AA88IJW1_ARTSF|nr:hypothetical protein QYM36_002644 [Artemia franciscana]